MFFHCTSLTKAPALPATTLADYCYFEMFLGCTSLTQAPELPATTLKTGCYRSMFQDCTSLSSVTMLATDVIATYCLYDWLKISLLPYRHANIFEQNLNTFYLIHLSTIISQLCSVNSLPINSRPISQIASFDGTGIRLISVELT